MISVYLMQGIYEGELFGSTHLTEKGALIAGIGDIVEYLGIRAESAEEAAERYHLNENLVRQVSDTGALNKCNREQLGNMFKEICTAIYDNPEQYQVDIIKSTIQP